MIEITNESESGPLAGNTINFISLVESVKAATEYTTGNGLFRAAEEKQGNKWQ
jgi:hypothetical protein